MKVLGIEKNLTIGVAVSGGSDSMALLHYLHANKQKFNIEVVAINVEHGIRGENSIKDSEFVANYCNENAITLYSYAVDSIEYSKNNGLSVEESARILRYNCFFDAISTKKCDKIATAHHISDNVESILFNLFRGTSLTGIGGIKNTDFIIRPLLWTSKEEIIDYINKNNLPFVTDETNSDDKYSRNYLRLNVIPKIKDAFPNFESSILRFSEIAKEEDDFLNSLAEDALTLTGTYAEISVETPKVVFARAVKKALISLGITKDYEKTHIDSVYNLISLENGAKAILPKNVVAIREYDKIVIFKDVIFDVMPIPFTLGEHVFPFAKLTAIKATTSNFKDGFYVDFDKIPKDAVIRTRRPDDTFTKFGGGTKKLNDYFTDKKIPKRLRDQILVIASGSDVLYVHLIGISDKLRLDNTTKVVVKLF